MAQAELLMDMEKGFQVTRKIFLNIKTGWFDKSRSKSNLASANGITVESIQGRYRLNFCDNRLKIQEFFFDLEWSSFAEDGRKIEVITKEMVDSRFPRLKRAAKRLLFILLKYIPKECIFIRASGSGLHIIFFLKGLEGMDEWELITRYLILKSKLPDTKHADRLVFGLDKDTILSSDRKISEFGSWNKLKKDLKKEVDYLNYATYLTVDDFFKARHYPFCPDFRSVKYPTNYQYFNLPEKLMDDAKAAKIEDVKPENNPARDLSPVKDFTPVKDEDIDIPEDDPAMKLKKCPAYWSILRKMETEWYERHFLVKFLKYTLMLSREQIIELIDRYTYWSDYSREITAYYVRKHFREGTCETKVKRPPKKKTLIKYGLCKNECDCCLMKTDK